MQKHGYSFDAQAGKNNIRFTLAFGESATGINTLTSKEVTEMEVYTLDGTKVGNTTIGIQKGIYVVRQGQQTHKVIIK